MAETPDRFARLKEILIGARAREGADRAAYLTDACAGDAGLRAEAEALLAHDGSLEALRTGAVFAAAGASSAAPVEHPDRVGPFAIAGVLGEGGMGVVYRAEQLEPIRRPVALKLVRRGMDSERILARFALERQTLALMNSPFIARVFDAGTTDDGRPFFAMELVDGISITRFAAGNRLGLPARLSLFIDVCRGVQHAHRQGIIHRDLKPSNVLVASPDGRPVPKIIDFGIAKVLGEAAGDLTEGVRGLGTPAYMSPEQAGVSDAPVDTRTDVYALGVLIYELLTGRPPYAPAAATPGEIYRALRETTPARPSLARPAADPVDPKALAGDLDSIVLKAIELDPDRRYASVEQLVEDLERHRTGLPVHARAATWRYRAGRFVSRHRAGVVAAAAVLIALVGSLAVALASLAEVARQRDAARDAETIANSTSTFLAEMLASANPADRGPGSTTELRVRDVLDDAVERLATGAVADRAVEAELRYNIGRSYTGLGNLAAACREFSHARGLAGEAAPLTARAITYIAAEANCLANLGRPAEASERIAVAAVHCETAEEPACASVLGSIGNIRYMEAKFPESIAAYRRSVALAPADMDSRTRFGSEFGLARALARNGEFDEAERLYRELIDRGDTGIGSGFMMTESARNGLAILYQATNRPDEAIAAYEQTLANMTRIAGAENDLTLRTRFNLGELYCQIGRLEACRDMVGAAYESRHRQFGSDHPSTIQYAVTYGSALFDTGDREEGLRLLAGALEAAGRVLREHPRRAIYLIKYAERLEKSKRYAEAEAAALEAHALAMAHPASRPSAKYAANVLVWVYQHTGRDEDAARWRALTVDQ